MPTFLALKWSIQQIKPNDASGSLLLILSIEIKHHSMQATKLILSYHYHFLAKK